MRTVACIDDDAIFVDRLGTELDTLGVRAVHFPEAAHFIAHPRIEEFDLALVDLDMPDSSGMQWEFGGMEVVKSIRARLGDSLEICILTGNDNPYMVDASVTGGADGFFEKSLDFKDLAKRIHHYLEHGPGA